MEKFDDMIIPGPAEMPPTPEEEKKPEVVLPPEDKERILAELEEVKNLEQTEEKRARHLTATESNQEVDFEKLTDEDLAMADLIFKGGDTAALESVWKSFEIYRSGISNDSNRSEFATFLGNRL